MKRLDAAYAALPSDDEAAVGVLDRHAATVEHCVFQQNLSLRSIVNAQATPHFAVPCPCRSPTFLLTRSFRLLLRPPLDLPRVCRHGSWSAVVSRV